MTKEDNGQNKEDKSKKKLIIIIAIIIILAAIIGTIIGVVKGCSGKFTVTFMNDGEVFSTQHVEGGKAAANPSTNPTKASTPQFSYEFAGWYANESDETVFDFTSSMINADITLYAKYNVTDLILIYKASDDSCVVSGIKETTVTELSVLERYEGMVVTGIGNHAFNNCRTLTSIDLPDSITTIGEYAFSNCAALSSITIPDKVTTIGDYAFYGCAAITSITIPKSVTSIGTTALFNRALTSIEVQSGNSVYHSEGNCLIETATQTLLVGCSTSVIPNDVKIIGSGAFDFCSFTAINIPDSVTTIGDLAFINCFALTSIIIPNSVTSIGKGTFDGCIALASVKMSNVLQSIPINTFSNCSALTSIVIPDSVTIIDNWAFVECSALTKITIGSGIVKINSYAFQSCFSLTSIEYNGTEAQWAKIEKQFFWDIDMGSYTITYIG